MIARIEGTLIAIEANTAQLSVGGSTHATSSQGLTYEVLLSAYTASRLGGSIGQSVSLRTLYYIESLAQGATMVPRLAGFVSVDDLRFFELFTTCKGIGNRRALRAMTLSTGQIATAIADGDVKLLQSLPEVGKRTAETMIASLRGKVDQFTAMDPTGVVVVGGSEEQGLRPAGVAREALDFLTQLGENRVEAAKWIDQALSQVETVGDVQDLLGTVYRIKAGG